MGVEETTWRGNFHLPNNPISTLTHDVLNIVLLAHIEADLARSRRGIRCSRGHRVDEYLLHLSGRNALGARVQRECAEGEERMEENEVAGARKRYCIARRKLGKRRTRLVVEDVSVALWCQRWACLSKPSRESREKSSFNPLCTHFIEIEKTRLAVAVLDYDVRNCSDSSWPGGKACCPKLAAASSLRCSSVL